MNGRPLLRTINDSSVQEVENVCDSEFIPAIGHTWPP